LPEVTLGMEAGFVMVAGSDTTSGALSNALFYLLTVPGPFKALRAELDAVADGAAFDIDMDSAVLASLPYLNAVMCAARVRQQSDTDLH
jgi:cytochrome P450